MTDFANFPRPGKNYPYVVKTTQVVLGLYVEFTTHVWEKHLCYVFLKLFPSHFFRMTPKNTPPSTTKLYWARNDTLLEFIFLVVS